jgi:hypothetical protein
MLSPCHTWLQVLKIDVRKYSRWVLVLPENRCPWAGLASVGCSRNCASWLKVGAVDVGDVVADLFELHTFQS